MSDKELLEQKNIIIEKSFKQCIEAITIAKKCQKDLEKWQEAFRMAIDKLEGLVGNEELTGTERENALYALAILRGILKDVKAK